MNSRSLSFLYFNTQKTIVKDSPLMGKNLTLTKWEQLRTLAQLCTRSMIRSLRWRIFRVSISVYNRLEFLKARLKLWTIFVKNFLKIMKKITGGRWSSFFRALTTRNVRSCWTTRFWRIFISLVRTISLMSGALDLWSGSRVYRIRSWFVVRSLMFQLKKKESKDGSKN